jgi:hypothetical protein
MAMTLRLNEADETRLRELADHEHRNLTDEIAALVQDRHALLRIELDQSDLALRAARRAAHRKALDDSVAANAELLELLSQ